jgi:hypothetical protein
VLVVRLPETLDLARTLVSSSAVGAVVVYWGGRVILEWRRGKNRAAEIQATGSAEVAKIEANSAAKIAETQAIGDLQLTLERERRKRAHRQLERPRPPPSR